MQCTLLPCCIFTLFFLIRMLSLQLYTWMQPSSVPSHIVGWFASSSVIVLSILDTSPLSVTLPVSALGMSSESESSELELLQNAQAKINIKQKQHYGNRFILVYSQSSIQTTITLNLRKILWPIIKINFSIIN